MCRSAYYLAVKFMLRLKKNQENKEDEDSEEEDDAEDEVLYSFSYW